MKERENDSLPMKPESEQEKIRSFERSPQFDFRFRRHYDRRQNVLRFTGRLETKRRGDRVEWDKHERRE